MSRDLKPIPEWHNVDEKVFKTEIVPQQKPAVLKGVVSNWPSVRYAMESPERIGNYLCSLDKGTLVNTVLVPPEFKGRVFYKDDMSGLNFLRNQLPISMAIHQIAKYSQFEDAPSAAVQCAKITDCIPGFMDENRLAILGKAVLPRIWLGGKLTVAAHFDEMDNLACVVSGKRRFTLFPPEQISNLYVGPLDFTPAGAPVSMVDFSAPDFERFPKFRNALDAAMVAELTPGDAIFIPAVWWHHVESLDVFNILVNYWWKDFSDEGAEKDISPVSALLYSLLSMRGLPSGHKKAWESVFAHYIFNEPEDSVSHIPDDKRGILGELSLEQRRKLLDSLKSEGN